MRQAAAGAYCCSLAYFKAIQSLQPICKPYNPCNTPTYTYIFTNLHIHYHQLTHTLSVSLQVEFENRAPGHLERFQRLARLVEAHMAFSMCAAALILVSFLLLRLLASQKDLEDCVLKSLPQVFISSASPLSPLSPLFCWHL